MVQTQLKRLFPKMPIDKIARCNFTCWTVCFAKKRQKIITLFSHFQRLNLLSLLLLTGVIHTFSAVADPIQDQVQFRNYYQKVFPNISLQDFADGLYAINADARSSWQAIEEFPPYEFAIEQGQTLFETAFANGKTYADCFTDGGIGIANQYPLWDPHQKKVLTLALAVNQCRIKNNATPLPYKQGAMAAILAYMAYTSRGKAFNIKIPDNNSQALAAYQQGKNYYYQRHGQLNFSCASCHIQNAGKRIRSEILSPSLGHTSHWPSYRLKWGEIGTLHRRFIGCHKQIRANSPAAQSDEFRHLEYFLSFMANGIKLNGPSTRK